MKRLSWFSFLVFFYAISVHAQSNVAQQYAQAKAVGPSEFSANATLIGGWYGPNGDSATPTGGILRFIVEQASELPQGVYMVPIALDGITESGVLAYPQTTLDNIFDQYFAEGIYEQTFLNIDTSQGALTASTIDHQIPETWNFALREDKSTATLQFLIKMTCGSTTCPNGQSTLSQGDILNYARFDVEKH